MRSRRDPAPEEVSRNLGHSSIAITADIYGHLTDEAARSAALVVSDALNL